ncbi:MAG: Holliday junction DNA helicase RuvB C-terminal domain-containing protein [Patescibacteria group bacterium]|nr:Holliday junction DNA helicase RuvB C-terminal domain-containing protein [Patescibacteria group bacterium]
MNLVGHTDTKGQIAIAMKAAKKRNMAMPHMLFSGLAGCGKTSMAQEIALISKCNFLSVISTNIRTHEDIIHLIEKMNHCNYNEQGDRIGTIYPTILFLDEVHQMPSLGQEILGLVMERFILDTGQPNKFYWAPYFTVIGATTDDGKLNKPFRERFKLRFIFEQYSLNEILKIVEMYSKKLNMVITNNSAIAIAKRSKGIPRIAVGYVERMRDFLLATDKKLANSTLTEVLFKKLKIDEEGLTVTERKLLKVLYDAKTPIGIDNLAMILNESPKNLVGAIEPFLMQKGFITRNNKGRSITKIGSNYIKHIDNSVEKEKSEITMDYIRK